MSFLIFFLLSLVALAAEPCVFPSEAKILLAEPTEEGVVVLAEGKSRCWYEVATDEKKVLSAAPWAGEPYDVKYHRASGRIFYYSAEASSLRSFGARLADDRLEASFGGDPVCETRRIGNMSVKSCAPTGGGPFRILVSDSLVALSEGAVLYVAPANFPLRFKGLVVSQKMFVHSVDWDPTSHRLWVLRNEPAGESILEWATLGKGPSVLLALPPLALYAAGIKRLYVVEGQGAVLLDNGQIHSESDFSLVGDLGRSFDEAYFLGSGLLTVASAGEGLFKVVAYGASYRPVAFEYLFRRPLRLVDGAEGPVAVMPNGSLDEIFQPLTLRKP